MGKPTLSVAARNKFALQHEKLVRKIAHKYSLQCREPWEDLFQIGYIGLLKAVERFDTTLGNAFSSFAVPYIQGEIQHFLRDEWGSVKVPRRDLEAVAKIKRVKRKLEALGANVDEASVAGALQIDRGKWQQLVQSVSGNLAVSLDAANYQMAAATPSAPEDEFPRIPREQIYKDLYSLPPLQCAIVQKAFFTGLSLATIAKRHEISVEEVSEILQQGLLQLSQKFNKAD